MSSQEVISLLDDVFTQCDAICAKHGVTKIKTIGDSYMAVSFGSVANAALCALEMSCIKVNYKVSHSVSHEVLFRIGMHCGPVTAGVIGKERMQYDVWGDTVNVASRMESTGEPGKVHVSEALAIELKSNTEYTIQNPVPHEVSHSVSHEVPLVTRHLSFATQLRGLVDIKGKGPMTTFWLENLP
jgi:class 3 adenylate cyclase